MDLLVSHTGVRPYIEQAEVNLDTGAVGEWRIIWNGTGGMVSLISRLI